MVVTVPTTGGAWTGTGGFGEIRPTVAVEAR